MLLVTDLQRGGTPMRVVRWASWLPRIGVTPIVGCLAPRGPLNDELDRCGIENFHCDAAGPFDLRVFPRLTVQIMRRRPDLVHAFLFHANVAARLVGRALGRPVITGTATVEIERIWHRRVETLTGRMSQLHVVNSHAVARHVVNDLHFPVNRVVVVPSGIDLAHVDATPPIDRKAWNLPDHVPLVIWCGRMDPIKRLDTWIEVFVRVRSQMNLCGVLVGDGPTRGPLEMALRGRGLLLEAGGGAPDHAVNRVRMIGWTDQVIAWLKAADALLLTSGTEGNPNIVLEAMAAGCAVISSAVGGCVDLIEPGRSGWLVSPTDTAGFVTSLEEACANPALRRRYASVARSHVEQCESPDSVLAMLDRVYQRVLRDSRR